MDVGNLIQTTGLLWSPLTFAMLIGFATVLMWRAFAPARPVQLVQDRLDGYLGDIVEDADMHGPFASRVLAPLFRRLLRILSILAPKRNLEDTRKMLLQAGEPGHLTVLDFLGLRLLFVLLLGVGYFLFLGKTMPFATAVRNSLIAAAVGFVLPLYWLRSRARRRKHQITRALPDALDMLTIGVEAGLAFESALLKVGDQWDNALTREFRRAVTEMRVGTPREVALQRIVERAGVQDLSTLVAVLIQSSQLGVSIAHVLHSQAAQMRVRRRQRAEEMARKAAIKMIFPLAILIFPSMLVVILGPSVPAFMSFFSGPGGGASFLR